MTNLIGKETVSEYGIGNGSEKGIVVDVEESMFGTLIWIEKESGNREPFSPNQIKNELDGVGTRWA